MDEIITGRVYLVKGLHSDHAYKYKAVAIKENEIVFETENNVYQVYPRWNVLSCVDCDKEVITINKEDVCEAGPVVVLGQEHYIYSGLLASMAIVVGFLLGRIKRKDGKVFVDMETLRPKGDPMTAQDWATHVDMLMSSGEPGFMVNKQAEDRVNRPDKIDCAKIFKDFIDLKPEKIPGRFYQSPSKGLIVQFDSRNDDYSLVRFDGGKTIEYANKFFDTWTEVEKPADFRGAKETLPLGKLYRSPSGNVCKLLGIHGDGVNVLWSGHKLTDRLTFKFFENFVEDNNAVFVDAPVNVEKKRQPEVRGQVDMEKPDLYLSPAGVLHYLKGLTDIDAVVYNPKSTTQVIVDKSIFDKEWRLIWSQDPSKVNTKYVDCFGHAAEIVFCTDRGHLIRKDHRDNIVMLDAFMANYKPVESKNDVKKLINSETIYIGPCGGIYTREVSGNGYVGLINRITNSTFEVTEDVFKNEYVKYAKVDETKKAIYLDRDNDVVEFDIGPTVSDGKYLKTGHQFHMDTKNIDKYHRKFVEV